MLSNLSNFCWPLIAISQICFVIQVLKSSSLTPCPSPCAKKFASNISLQFEPIAHAHTHAQHVLYVLLYVL
ncbi:hypothetical protein F4813DRAFT_357703 [Daldinia decipiens]|uniref:uncharacterized protein n=1 Tax=Daldinia decipiens TaxID=326647 RepID=UPI0020C2DFD8|nr:uncharacterized protein F4813DRAFT_357703 [Daldinia decipiens]KAI1658194.1 hypothetical protein F4813DRAFT_357703 [Daldinia decipiens]